MFLCVCVREKGKQSRIQAPACINSMELIHLQDTDGFDSAPETLFSDNEKNREGYLCALCPNA